MEEYEIDCPFCGEKIDILIDCSIEQQQYTEDCQVCCAPMLLSITADPQGTVTDVTAQQENG